MDEPIKIDDTIAKQIIEMLDPGRPSAADGWRTVNELKKYYLKTQNSDNIAIATFRKMLEEKREKGILERREYGKVWYYRIKADVDDK